jgi:Uma2 family endonuclease
LDWIWSTVIVGLFRRLGRNFTRIIRTIRAGVAVSIDLEPMPAEPMTSDAFVVWAARQPSARYELQDGYVVRSAAERAGHVRAKQRSAAALQTSVATAGIACEAFGDGLSVRIDAMTVYEPDAIVLCGPRIPDETVTVDDPIIVVEVLSPSTQAVDMGAKMEDYLRLPSVAHYLVVNPTRRAVIHHARDGDAFSTRILHDGVIRLDPPGLSVAVADMLPPSPNGERG